VSDKSGSAAAEIVERLAEITDVRAVTITGSRAHGRADPTSDLDLFVYVEHQPSRS
jgi:predicted nucleotidyltransferase